MLDHDNIHKLPNFKNHQEAKEYFEKYYGDRFVDTHITTTNSNNGKRSHLYYIKIAGRVVRPLKITKDGDIKLID